MTSQAVLLILEKRATESGVESFSPHDFRRTFCSDLLDSGIDIVTVQKLAGHASPATTSKYDRRGEESKRRAVEKLDIPYTPRRNHWEYLIPSVWRRWLMLELLRGDVYIYLRSPCKAIAVACFYKSDCLKNALTHLAMIIKVIHHDELHDLISVDSPKLPRWYAFHEQYRA